MTEQELQTLLSEKDGRTGRENASLILSPYITRNAARLKKLKRDRRQAALCLLAATVFILLTVGLSYLLKTAESPVALLKPVLIATGSEMLLTLILSPFLAWYSDEERKNSGA